MKIVNTKGIIVEDPRQICEDHYILCIRIPDISSYPGQFVNIRIGKDTDPLLRRPFSIYNHKDDLIEIVFKIVGKGTEQLRNYVKNDKIDIIAPLGTGFKLIKNSRALLIGGGVGNAPLYYLTNRLKGKNNHITSLYGSKSKDSVFLRERYVHAADCFIISTDDGSEGRKGFVTDIARDLLKNESFDYIYSCGPSNMLRELMTILEHYDIPVEVSVERYFGCGIGLCYGCTVITTNGFKRACIDGPVFNGREIDWNT